ncbi:MAG TPA: (d)CMP kinase [Gemmatimonadaceae bacterium]|nr:(d)CMP kinase [Gemmatimonadaceae bacterium]
MTHPTPPFSPRIRRGSPAVVAIDGPAASGKSSTAQWVAEQLGYRHVDSGALYRAATAARLAAGGTSEAWTEESVLEAARRITLIARGTSFVPAIDGRPVDERIRDGEVTRHVSEVARMPRVRDWVNAQVRRAASQSDVVVDGRDIGTVVLPQATLKVFLVADPWERASRRLLQRLGRRATDEEIAEETDRLVQRDANDATQTLQAKDAILIDTTYLTQADQVERIVALARAVTQHPDTTSSIDDQPPRG